MYNTCDDVKAYERLQLRYTVGSSNRMLGYAWCLMLNAEDLLSDIVVT